MNLLEIFCVGSGLSWPSVISNAELFFEHSNTIFDFTIAGTA
jgi:hypothetical protein